MTENNTNQTVNTSNENVANNQSNQQTVNNQEQSLEQSQISQQTTPDIQQQFSLDNINQADAAVLVELLKSKMKNAAGMTDKQIANTEPHLVSYINEDLKEKSSLRLRVTELEKENSGLKGQLGRVNDITLLAKYGFDAGKYNIIQKLCDYSITDDKLVDLAKQANYDWLRAKRSAQRAQVNMQARDEDPLFSDLIGKNKNF